MPRLTEDEFKATMESSPVPVPPDEGPPFDFWPYVDAVPQEDLGGHGFSTGLVAHAWNMPNRGYQHVLVRCDTPDVFLVLVLDLTGHRVHGHHLLDLGHLYGTR